MRAMNTIMGVSIYLLLALILLIDFFNKMEISGFHIILLALMIVNSLIFKFKGNLKEASFSLLKLINLNLVGSEEEKLDREGNVIFTPSLFFKNHFRKCSKKVLKIIYDSFNFFEIDQYDKAIELIQNAKKLEPKNKVVWYLSSMVYYKTKKYENALSDINKSLELDSEFYESIMLKGNILIKMGLSENEK